MGFGIGLGFRVLWVFMWWYGFPGLEMLCCCVSGWSLRMSLQDLVFTVSGLVVGMRVRICWHCRESSELLLVALKIKKL